MAELTVERRTEIPVPVERLRAYHEHPACFARLAPPWQRFEILERSGGLGIGARTAFRARRGPFKFTWVAEHTRYDGNSFTDEQRRGPFAAWRHEHRFIAIDPNRCALIDEITAQLPLDRFVPPRVRASIERELHALLRVRHRVTTDDLIDPAIAPQRIAVTGARGLIGTRLCARLEIRGHEVIRLVRRRPQRGEVRWDPDRPWDASALDGIDTVIHLAGESIGGGLPRWTAAKKRRIFESRARGTASLARALASMPRSPRTLVSVSAVGSYGDGGDATLGEDAPNGAGFLAEVCRAWEEAADPARTAGIRVVHPRIGLVLAAQSGAMKPLIWLARAGLTGPIGGGRQWWPWISLHDVVRGLEHLATTSTLEGPVNLAGPEPVTQRAFVRAIARAYQRPAVLPAPAFAIRALLGELGGVLLEGQRVSTERLRADGFRHAHETLPDAIADELGR